jgi:hypothetical protein
MTPSSQTTASFCGNNAAVPRRQNYFRQLRDQLLAESLTIPPPKYTTI